MSNVTNAAVAAINEQRHAEAREKARRLILAIEQSNKVIESRSKNLSHLQEELKKLAVDQFNVVDIAGSLPDSVSAETIRETIAELNKGEQGRVAGRCADLDLNLRNEQAALDAETTNRAGLRKALSEIKVESVSTETIGQ
jgi:hypothetical protein